MTKAYYTYLHCRPDGAPFYVGKGTGTRAHHFTKNRNPHYAHVVAKYGSANLLVYVFPCDSEAEAFADERIQIASLRADGFDLVNYTDGGEGPSGRKATPEQRARISAAHVGRKWSPESIAKRSATNRGSKRSEATRAKMAEAQRGRVVSDGTRAKLSAINLGRTHTPQARAKISAAHIGKKHALGYRHTPEAITKIAHASRRKRPR